MTAKPLPPDRDDARKAPSAPERMDPHEVLAEMQKVHLVVPFILGLETERLLATFSMADTVGPLFSPTAWRRNADRMRSNQEIVGIIATAKRKLRKVMDDYPQALGDRG